VRASRRPAPWRWLSRLIGAVFIGWIVVYNVMRLAGSSPADAAWPSLAIGAAAALVLVGLGTLAMGLPGMSRLADPRGTAEIPLPAGRSDAQRRAIGLAWPALGVLAVIAIVVGAYLIIDALRQGGGRPAATVLILTAWNVLAGLWLGDESIRSRRGEVDGLDSAVLGCLLTAVLAAVGISRNLAEPAQVILIAAAGVAGALTSYAVWRLRGSTGAPVGAALVAIVAGLCIALPLTL
jgi:hypothetical protein